MCKKPASKNHRTGLGNRLNVAAGWFLWFLKLCGCTEKNKERKNGTGADPSSYCPPMLNFSRSFSPSSDKLTGRFSLCPWGRFYEYTSFLLYVFFLCFFTTQRGFGQLRFPNSSIFFFFTQLNVWLVNVSEGTASRIFNGRFLVSQ